MTIVQGVYKTIGPNQKLKSKDSKMTISKEKKIDFAEQIVLKTWKYPGIKKAFISLNQKEGKNQKFQERQTSKGEKNPSAKTESKLKWHGFEQCWNMREFTCSMGSNIL